MVRSLLGADSIFCPPLVLLTPPRALCLLPLTRVSDLLSLRSVRVRCPSIFLCTIDTCVVLSPRRVSTWVLVSLLRQLWVDPFALPALSLLLLPTFVDPSSLPYLPACVRNRLTQDPVALLVVPRLLLRVETLPLSSRLVAGVLVRWAQAVDLDVEEKKPVSNSL